MHIDRPTFFASVRKGVFGGVLTQAQVDGITVMLDEAPAAMAAEPLAYCFATAFHETARTMQPIAEIGRGRGRSYGKPDPLTGQTYFGRGLVQLTWLANYRRAGKELGLDLVNKPDLAMQPDHAAAIMFRGMVEGWFTGKKLADYFGPGRSDPVGARRIINGTDRASLIAGYHGSFLAALQAAASAPAPVAARPALAPASAATPGIWARLFGRKAA